MNIELLPAPQWCDDDAQPYLAGGDAIWERRFGADVLIRAVDVFSQSSLAPNFYQNFNEPPAPRRQPAHIAIQSDTSRLDAATARALGEALIEAADALAGAME